MARSRTVGVACCLGATGKPPQLPECSSTATTRDVALRRAKALALETIAGLAGLGEADIDAMHFDAA